MRNAGDRWEIETSPEFDHWWDALTPSEVDDIGVVVELLALRGPSLGFPFSSKVRSTRTVALRELRIQHRGRPYRTLYAFNPRRVAVLLLGGDKTGDDRWYQRNVRRAEGIFLARLQQEGT